MEEDSQLAHSILEKNMCRRATCSKIRPILTRKTDFEHDLEHFHAPRAYESVARTLRLVHFPSPIENFETQRLQVLQTNFWDNAQSERISLCGELEMRNKLFQESRTKDCQEIEELRRRCCEETREFHDPETAGSSGASHVTSPPLTNPSYRTVPGRDSGLPPETLNMLGISDVFERLPAREGQPQNISKKSRNLASSSRGVKPKLTEHTMTTGSKRRPEQQDLSNSRNILHCGDEISRHTGGTYSHGGMMEYPRFPISELHLAKFPDSMEF